VLRRAVFAATGIVVAALVSGAAAQQKAAEQHPDFTGTWVVVSPKDMVGQQESIAHDATMLVRGHSSESGEHLFAYKLDGSESRNVITMGGQDIVTLSRASWSGDHLTIAGSTTYPDGRKLEQNETWTLGKDGRLSIEYSQTMGGKTVAQGTVIYQRQ
jgi:hypothetical protein